MNSSLLFLFACIPVRIGLVILCKSLSKKLLPTFGWFCLLIAVGFLSVYNRRMKGIETNNKRIWWNEFRPVHACLYFLTFVYAVQQKSYSWIPLAVDVLLGFLLFLFYKETSLSQTFRGLMFYSYPSPFRCFGK